MWAVEIQIFWPLSDVVVAVGAPPAVRRLARSLPASGSLKPWHQCSSASRMFGQPPLLLLVGAPADDHRADLPEAVGVVDAGRAWPAPSPRSR